MTDRYMALTVILEHDIRDDDAEPLIAAIRLLKGVQDVQPIVSDPSLAVAESRARRELQQKLWDIVFKRT
jgi:hypothetical protein